MSTKCNHNCPLKKEAEGYLTTVEKAMWQMETDCSDAARSQGMLAASRHGKRQATDCPGASRRTSPADILILAL